tara:strand:- start:270 stop:584 length:315 start_codon:yes stop_codon:yes gene_type:complete
MREKKMRVRRHIHDQLLSLGHAIDKLISAKGKNKDFLELPEETQKMFFNLLTAIDVTQRKYGSFLWDKAVLIEKAGGNAKAHLPENMCQKVKAVSDYMATLQKE